MKPPFSSGPIGAPAEGKPLCVLLVIEPGKDGAFRFVEQLAYFLLRQPGVSVHLAYSSIRGSPDLHTLVQTLERHGSKTLDLRTTNAPRPADLVAFVRLRRLVRKTRPDVIHAHCSKAGVLARLLAWTGIRVPIVYTPHAYFQMYGPVSLKSRFFLMVERLLARTGITLHTSRSEADYARRLLGVPPIQQQHTRTGVDCDRFRPARDPEEKAALRRRCDLPANARVFGTVARYSEQKDPLTLYRGVVAVLETMPEVYFAHLGTGELMPAVTELLNMAPANVRARIRQIERCEDLPGFYRMLDGFVLASRYEGFALALLEALASGLPLILSDCPGNVDLREHGLNDLHWTAMGNADQLAAQMSALAAVGSSVNNHRETAVAVFGGDVGCKDVLRCYQSASTYDGPGVNGARTRSS